MKLHLHETLPPDVGPHVEAHARLRDGRTMASLALAATAIALVPLLPGASERLDVGVRETSLAMGVYMVVAVATAAVFRWRGPGPAYWWMSTAEIWTATGCLLGLVYASGNPLSPFWLLFLVLLLVNALEPALRRIDWGALVAGPPVVAVAFLARGEVGQAGLVLCVAATLTSFLVLFRSLFVGLTEARNERDRLGAEVAELRLREERSRISRDLHDGLGTELASLTWLARDLQQRPEGTPLKSEVAEILERLRCATDELRAVVWALRAERRTWGELVGRLRRRCGELGAGADVVVSAAPEEGGPTLEGQLALGLVRAVQELVHNCARHSGATRIAVALRLEEGVLRCTVEDDGRGLSAGVLGREEGGLRNVRTRVGAVGGTLTIQSGPSGTRVDLTLPLASGAAQLSLQESRLCSAAASAPP